MDMHSTVRFGRTMCETSGKTPRSAVPTVARLIWLMFMQPGKLHTMSEEWGLHDDPSLWAIRELDEPAIRPLVTRYAMLLFVVGPVVALVIGALLSLWFPIRWDSLALGIAAGVLFGAVFSTALGLAGGVAFGMALSSALGAAFGGVDGAALGLVFGGAMGLAGGGAFGVRGGEPLRLPSGAVDSIVAGVVSGVVLGMVLGLTDGPVSGLVGSLSTIAMTLRLPVYLMEVTIIGVLWQMTRYPDWTLRAARWLPYLHHELIRFPLPGLAQILYKIGLQDEDRARRLIAEGQSSNAQAGPATRAYLLLQANALRDPNRDYKFIVELRGPFYPPLQELDKDDALTYFVDAAKNILSAQSDGTQDFHRIMWNNARRNMDDLKSTCLAKPTEKNAHLNGVANDWLNVINDKYDEFERLAQANPEVPNVYIAGTALRPESPRDKVLFRERRDLLVRINHHLGTDQRGLLFVVGQRRMGKTSLLNMLPDLLGATKIANLTFQSLEGEGDRRRPHLIVARALKKVLADVPNLSMPELVKDDRWDTTREWLKSVDGELKRLNVRALVAIDEIERLQDGIEQGWADGSFLAFLRACEDLERIRMLIASAYPASSPKLGGAWVDHLISATPMILGPLEREDAESLLRHPTKEFPTEVFSKEIADEILAQTGTHPFLIQLVGKEVVHRLHRLKKRSANSDDVGRALDASIEQAENLFEDLWNNFTKVEQELMAGLARGEPVASNSREFKDLKKIHFITESKDSKGRYVLTFPLFGRWIRDYPGVSRDDADDQDTTEAEDIVHTVSGGEV